MKPVNKLFFLILLPPLFIGAAVSNARGADLPKEVTDPAKAFVSGSFVVKGEGVAPSDTSLSKGQKRLMALRAAKVEAMRELLETINGVAISRDRTIMAASASSGAISATVQGFIRGAVVIKQSYDASSEVGTVYLKAPLTGPDGLVVQLLPEVMPESPTPALAVTPTEKAVEYNGLIIDVTQLNFKPALVNKVVAKNGESIYDPTRVAQSILVSKGPAEYTNEIGKAKALLAERGANKPIVVKGSALIKSTDVLIRPADATAIVSSNQSNNYLEGAKVVFVLK